VARDHFGKKKTGEVGEGGDVDLDHLDLALQWQVREMSLSAEAGVVDEHVYLESCRLQRGGELRGSIALRKVAAKDVGLNVIGFPQVRGEGFELILASRDEHKLRAIASKTLCQFQTDARGGAGYEDGFKTHTINEAAGYTQKATG